MDTARGFELVFVLIALVGQLAGCHQTPAHCADNDKDCARAGMRDSVVRKFDYWTPALVKPLPQRIGPAPAELVEYLRLDNIQHGYADRPRVAGVTPDLLQDVREAIDEIPEPVRRRLSSRLAGIYFVEDLGSTGYTEQAYDSKWNPVAGVVVLDAGVLNQRTANAWASWKENTPFKPAGGYGLRAEIEDKTHDTRKSAIQYILLHEFGHVLAIGGKFDPSWDVQPRDVKNPAEFPFFALSWTVSFAQNSYFSLYDAGFPQRTHVVFYFGPRLSADQMPDVYEHLERTNYATLYAASNPFDDFAEAFANYVHVQMMGKPFAITITRDGKIAKVYGPCWAQSRCAEKRKIIEQFLGAK